jgi:hypothetical protein
MSDPAGGGLIYDVLLFVEWLKSNALVAILGFFVLLAVIMASSMIFDRFRKRRKKND